MPDDASNGQTAPPALNISADFLTGSTDVGLDRIRTRLLDLTNRNKLLNFRHLPASSLRIVSAPIDAVFLRLRDNEKLVFVPVPEPPTTNEFDPPEAQDYAEQLGWYTSYDLQELEWDDDGALPLLRVLHYPERLDTLSRKIASAARTAIEESGTNMLYLVFGFLEWYESDDSQEPHLAPLVTMPVTLERSGAKGKVVEAFLEYSGEDVDTNLSLVEKMRRHFGVEIPTLEESDTPTSYFERFSEILGIKRRWRIRQQTTLALLSFGKLLMYRDLDPKTWPASQSLSKNPLVRELFEGTKTPNITLAEEYPIDAPELKTEVPHLIRDADSSQHSALVHALRGQNLVIEGPPGTGKSQTITNLIAASLAKGKTVLFVSEKLAALEVVRRRLDDAGLGLFCLEVHSHKTKKGALLNDLAQRYASRGSFTDPRDLDRHLGVVEEKKRLLTQYATLINKSIEPFGATVFEILWARDRCGLDVAPHRNALSQVLLPAMVQYTPTIFTQTEQFLAVYSQHLSGVLGAWKSIDQHPWVWVSRPLSFEEEERTLSLLDELLRVIATAEENCCRLEDSAAVSLTRTPQGLERASYALTLLPETAGPLLPDLLLACRNPVSRLILAEFVRRVENFDGCMKQLCSVARNARELLNAQARENLLKALETVSRWNLDECSIAKIKELRDAGIQTAKSIAQAHISCRELLDALGCDTPADVASANCLLGTLTLIETAPIEQLPLRQPTFENNDARQTVMSASREAGALKERKAILEDGYNLQLCASLHSPEQLLGYSTILDGASLWQRLFGGEYRAATRAYRSIAATQKKASRRHMAAALKTIGEFEQLRRTFEENAVYRATIGSHFKGIDSSWEELTRITAWCEEVFLTLPDHHAPAAPFRKLVFSAKTERLRSVKAEMNNLSVHRATLDASRSAAADLALTLPGLSALTQSGAFTELHACIEKLTNDLTAFIRAAERVTLGDGVHVRDIAAILSVADQCFNDETAIQTVSDIPSLIGEAFRGAYTDVTPIRQTLQFAESIAASEPPQKTVEWLLCPDYQPHLAHLRGWLSEAHACAGKFQRIASDLARTSGASSWTENLGSPWHSMQQIVERAFSAREDLSQWTHFLRLRIKSKEDGLQKLTGLADAQKLAAQELVPAYHFVFYNTLARSVFAEHDELSQVTGVTQEQIRQQFATADREAIRLYSQRVAAIIDRRPIPAGNQGGPVRSWTDMALVINEINKQKRHIPIRQLILRAAKALLALKPCFMMGPLSVAQYLAPGQLKFDLVIMDEASQLKPEDAIGALARGSQVVIVGDPKQLPPTTFFQRVSIDNDGDESEEDTRTAIEEGESILDVASTLFQPVRRLRWHYRSRHHSLIAFSNNEFYGDLVIFPSAHHDDPSLGVKYHFVAGGVFENSRNPREADVVVDAVLEHMRDHPDESLGVVTLNFEQRELVEELLDRRLREDPFAVAYQERMTGGQETFFIKNLENVQGDERDVIFISTTYGADTRGNQYQRFGPINGPNGHRRLNVLFTRAKKRVVVFSSLDPGRIQTTPNSPWGVRALKQYLIFARTGILQQPDEGQEQPTNDFERSVGAVLKERRYDIAAQVGVAGFFIDLAVKHPLKPGTFLLGIECDGASYHSGRSARDRDRLRQEILVNLGWKIHRIWSTDWFKNRDSEIKRLTRRIEELLAADPYYQAQAENNRKLGSLREQLMTLWQTEIKADFPDSSEANGLFGNGLLDELLDKRPTNRDEWFRKIPHNMRVSIDSKQVAKYLDRVLGIIAEHNP